jgi:hypothetical protein
MNVHDLAAARAKRLGRRVTTKSSTPDFCKVYDIETARQARNARIPDEVYEEMEAAAELYEQLFDEGRQIRFANVGGRVIAALCSLDGQVIRPLTLLEAIELDEGPETAA